MWNFIKILTLVLDLNLKRKKNQNAGYFANEAFLEKRYYHFPRKRKQ